MSGKKWNCLCCQRALGIITRTVTFTNYCDACAYRMVMEENSATLSTSGGNGAIVDA